MMGILNFLKIKVGDWVYFREGQEKINFILKSDHGIMLNVYKELIEDKGQFDKFIESNKKFHIINKRIFVCSKPGTSFILDKEFYAIDVTDANLLVQEAHNVRPNNRVEEFKTFPHCSKDDFNSYVCCFLTQNLNEIISQDELEWAIEIKPKAGVLKKDSKKYVCGYCQKKSSTSKYCSNFFYSKNTHKQVFCILNLIKEKTKRIRIIKNFASEEAEKVAYEISKFFSGNDILQKLLFLQNYSCPKQIDKDKNNQYENWNEFVSKLKDNLDLVSVNQDKCKIEKNKIERKKPMNNYWGKFAFHITKVYRDVSFIILKGKDGRMKMFLLDVELKPFYKQL